MKKLKGDNLSKFLSQILRHKPEKIQLELDEFGYADISQFIENSRNNGYQFSREELQETVKENDKKRFLIKNDKIKATQGHSFEVALETEPIQPPKILYHGTKFKLKEIIEQQGIKRMKRNLVHMNEGFEKSILSGSRRFEKPLLFEIRSLDMFWDGYKFYKSENDVWLTEYINPKYIEPKEISDLYEDYQEVQITTSNRYKILKNDYKLVSREPNQTILKGQNCFFCSDGKSNLVFLKDHVRCEVLGYIKKRNNHYLEGKLVSNEIKQDETSLISSKTCHIYMPLKNLVKFDVLVEEEVFYSNGFNYLCGECGEENGISNLGKIGEEYSCRKCKKSYFKMEERTEVEIKKASNNG